MTHVNVHMDHVLAECPDGEKGKRFHLGGLDTEPVNVGFDDNRESEPIKCGCCKGLIAYVSAPPGVYGVWEGWFHLDPSLEHFGRVGPR